MSPLASLALALRFSLREMRGGIKGFAVFLACIALGVGAIGGVHSVSRSINAGIAGQGQVILGGDLRFELENRDFSGPERSYLASLGEIAASAGMRSMARRFDEQDQTLVELKAVDGQFPLYGDFRTQPEADHEALFQQNDGVWGAVAPDLLLDRLDLKIGDRILLGDAVFELRAQLLAEPDLVSDGFGLAPRLMISLDGLRAASLIRPGSLVEHRIKIRLAADTGESEIEALANDARQRFPQAGWSIRDRTNAAPSLARNVERFSQFLSLVGLTTLVVGGVGVANAVRAHLAGKRSVIATLKCLGASGRFAMQVYLIQILIIAAIAIAIGLLLSVLIQALAIAFLTNILPIEASFRIFPSALSVAILFGVLVTITFAILSLGRARDIPAAELFRTSAIDAARWPRRIYVFIAMLAATILCATAIYLSRDRYVASIFIGAVAASFIILRLVAILIQDIARRSPSVRSTPLRLAIGNIHRPGALTPSVVLSLGLGLTLLVALALIEGNLRRQISGSIVQRAPDFFFVDISSSEIDSFARTIGTLAPQGKLVTVPMLRGRLMALDGVPVAEIADERRHHWVLRGDRGVTYARSLPENSTLLRGRWWPQDYSGPPLVSFSAEEAQELDLNVGDTVAVNVLGREITAEIANLRTVEWESLGINFVMVFTPVTFAGAPHAWLATLTSEGSAADGNRSIPGAVTQEFPAVTTVSVKEALDIVNGLIAQIATSIRAAAALALVASVLVLSGALSAGNRTRIADSVVLKTLGATRRTLIGAYCLEYSLIGAATAIFAILAGGLAAWFVLARIMQLQYSFQPEIAIVTVCLSLLLTVGFGLIGTWRVLNQKAAPVLREKE